jgi:hypothetical protein
VRVLALLLIHVIAGYLPATLAEAQVGPSAHRVVAASESSAVVAGVVQETTVLQGARACTPFWGQVAGRARLLLDAATAQIGSADDSVRLLAGAPQHVRDRSPPRLSP